MIPSEAVPYFIIGAVCFMGAGGLALYWLKLDKDIKGK